MSDWSGHFVIVAGAVGLQWHHLSFSWDGA